MASSLEEDVEKLREWLSVYRDEGAYKVLGKSFSREKALCVTQLLVDGHGKEVLAELERFHSNGNIIDKEPLLFALALCCKSSDKHTKTQAVRVCQKLCRTPRELFQLIKFCGILSLTRSWGRNFKGLVSKWYHSQNAYDLAKNVTRELNYCGWSHRDTLRMGHIRGENDEVDLIFKYLVLGFSETQKSYGKSEKAEIKKLMELITAVDSVKHGQDVHQVARLVEIHGLHKDHVKTELLNHKEVWSAVIQNIPYTDMLENIQHLAKIDCLNEDFEGSQHFVERLRNENLLKEEKNGVSSPKDQLIRFWEQSGQSQGHEKIKNIFLKQWRSVQPFDILIASKYYETGKKEVSWSHNKKVTDALDFALDYSIKNNMTSTNKRYLIAVRLGVNKIKTSVRGTMVLNSVMASAGVAMVTAKKEDKVDLVFFTDKVSQLTLTSESKLVGIMDEISAHVIGADEAQKALEDLRNEEDKGKEDVFRGVLPDLCDLVAPIRWATEQKKNVDVFILLTDSNRHTGATNLGEAIAEYRKDMALPSTKLITVGLTNPNMKFANLEDKAMLDISGFDRKVPQVIHKFVTGQY